MIFYKFDPRASNFPVIFKKYLTLKQLLSTLDFVILLDGNISSHNFDFHYIFDFVSEIKLSLDLHFFEIFISFCLLLLSTTGGRGQPGTGRPAATAEY